jgi:hypothetical protein
MIQKENIIGDLVAQDYKTASVFKINKNSHKKPISTIR